MLYFFSLARLIYICVYSIKANIVELFVYWLHYANWAHNWWLLRMKRQHQSVFRVLFYRKLLFLRLFFFFILRSGFCFCFILFGFAFAHFQMQTYCHQPRVINILFWLLYVREYVIASIVREWLQCKVSLARSVFFFSSLSLSIWMIKESHARNIINRNLNGIFP